MITAKQMTRVWILATGLLLTACGSGGGEGTNSTPIPTPTPAPSPTPTPTPTPTPVPPSSGVNDDLIAPLVSESFANNAATAAISFSKEGEALSQSQSAQSLTVSYNVSNDSYTIQVPGRSQTFGPAHRQVVGSYRRTSGNVTDDLTLTPNGPSEGSAYRYVGAGFWQRQTQRSDGGIDGSIDAFTYGIPTAALVRSGRAYYATEIIGSASASSNLYTFKGNGTLLADLGTGAVSAQGSLQYSHVPTGTTVGGGIYQANLTISVTENAMTGGIRLPAINAMYNGPINGKFFGPSAEELGASFSAVDSQGNAAVGALLGRKDPTQELKAWLDMTATKSFDILYYGHRHNGALIYNPTSKTYTFAGRTGSGLSSTPPSYRNSYGQFELGAAQKAGVQSSSKFTEYNGTVNGQAVKVLFYNYGTDNSELQLSYASFYRLQIGTPGYIRYEVYGHNTPTPFIPTSGTANYRGPIYGVGEDPAGTIAYDITGQSNFDINFGAGGLRTGLLDMRLKSLSDGSVIALAKSVNFISPFISSNQGSGAVGYLSHQFYGSNAEELGVSFGFVEEVVSGALMSVSGVTVAKKQ